MALQGSDGAACCPPRRHRTTLSRRRAVAGAVLVVLAIAVPSPPALADLGDAVLDMINELIGHNGEDARELAGATVAATRSTDDVPEDQQPVALGGAIGTVPQSVDRSRPLRLAWHGGRPPFRVEVAAPPGKELLRDLTSNARATVLELADLPPGPYRLIISAAEKSHLSLRLMLVEPADIPVAPRSADAATDEQKALLEAVWLLMRGGVKWHLEALSELQALADVRGSGVAKLILAPP